MQRGSDETPLGGEVVRRGQTVARPAGPWSETVQALLGHLRERGLAWVPEPLGFGPDGREIVGYVDGDVYGYPLPAWMWSEAVLVATARLLRRYHDATAGFQPASGPWQLPAHEPREVICHNDAAPYNLVFRGREPYGLIDFETASPGPRAWDLAYTAYRLVPLAAPGNPDLPASSTGERAARLARLCAAYGADGPSPRQLLETAPERLEELRAHTEALASDTRAGVRPLAAHARLYAADAGYVRAAADELRSAAERHGPGGPSGLQSR